MGNTANSHLLETCRLIGLRTCWRDYTESENQVDEEHIRAILDQLGYPASTDAELSSSLRRALRKQKTYKPPILIAHNESLSLRPVHEEFSITTVDGVACEVGTSRSRNAQILGPFRELGYFELRSENDCRLLIVHPSQSPSMQKMLRTQFGWGASAQVYSFASRVHEEPLSERLAAHAARLSSSGCDAIMISPLHAQFAALPDDFAPYSPSSQLALNPIYFGRKRVADSILDKNDYINWRSLHRHVYEALEHSFSEFKSDLQLEATLTQFLADAPDYTIQHIVFETLFEKYFRQHGPDWRKWPVEYHQSELVIENTRQHEPRFWFHAYCQMIAEREFERLCKTAKLTGMGIGVINDLSVGVRPDGSQVWSSPDLYFNGLQIGAPPDQLQHAGQAWGLTFLTPEALRSREGIEQFRSIIKYTMKHSGGVRMDHIMRLQRLWVAPEGEPSSRGAYLDYPENILRAIISLEATLNDTILIGEDLGTVDPAFRARNRRSGYYGTKVLWHEFDENQNLNAPAHWETQSVGMIQTHDMPTVSSWWSGGATATDLDSEPRDKSRLRQRKSILAHFNKLKNDSDETLDPDFHECCCEILASSNCELVVFTMEDLFRLPRRHNIPGTTNEYPNWRVTYPNFSEVDWENVEQLLRKVRSGRPPNQSNDNQRTRVGDQNG